MHALIQRAKQLAEILGGRAYLVGRDPVIALPSPPDVAGHLLFLDSANGRLAGVCLSLTPATAAGASRIDEARRALAPLVLAAVVWCDLGAEAARACLRHPYSETWADELVHVLANGRYAEARRMLEDDHASCE